MKINKLNIIIFLLFYSCNTNYDSKWEYYFINNSLEIFSCEIEETHHTEKIDFPSGTAIDLRNFIMLVDKKNIVKSIKITSFRKENVYGDHKVSFYNKENFRNFVHEALSRDIFAKGALKRAESLFQAKPGLYDLSSFK